MDQIFSGNKHYFVPCNSSGGNSFAIIEYNSDFTNYQTFFFSISEMIFFVASNADGHAIVLYNASTPELDIFQITGTSPSFSPGAKNNFNLNVEHGNGNLRKPFCKKDTVYCYFSHISSTLNIKNVYKVDTAAPGY